MLRFDKIRGVKEVFYGEQSPIKIWHLDIDNKTISKLVETNNDSNYLNGYLDEFIRPIVLVLPKMIRYVHTFKGKDGDTNWCLCI